MRRARSLPVPRRARWLAFAGLALALVATACWMRRSAERASAADLARLGSRRVEAMQARIEACLEETSALRELARLSAPLDAREFAALAARIRSARPEIRALAWASVPLASASSDPLPVELSSAEPSERLDGFDLRGIARWCDAFEPVPPARVAALPDDPLAPGITASSRWFSMPVEGESEARGFLLARIDLGRCLEAGLECGVPRPGGLDLYFIDVQNRFGPETIYVHRSRTRGPEDSRPPDAELASSAPHYEQSFLLGGRIWTLLCATAPRFDCLHASWFARGSRCALAISLE